MQNSETGFAVEHEEALEVFKKAGAKIDGQIVKIDEKLLNDCLKLTPSSFEITSRGGKTGIGPEYEPAIGTLFGPPFVLDHNTNEYRKGTLQDTVDFLKLAESSDVVSVSNLSVMDGDGLDKTLDNTWLPQQALMLKYTTQPIMFGAMGNLSLSNPNKRVKDAIVENDRLVQRFYGVSEDTLIGMHIVNGISPLCINYDAAENILGAITSNQGVLSATLSIPNMTCPPTLMGTVVHDNAIALAELVLTQLLKPNTPFIRCGLSASTDMRSVAMNVGGPQAMLNAMAYLALGRYYNVPTRMCGSESDAYEPDYQAGVESFMGLLPMFWGNSDYELHPAGILGSFNIGSYEKFVLDEETMRYHKRIRQGIAISKEKAFTEQMNSIGPRGNYLSVRTPKDYRQEHPFYNLFNKTASTMQTRKERGTLRDNARDIINKRLNEYKVPETTKEQMDILNPYLPAGFKYEDEK